MYLPPYHRMDDAELQPMVAAAGSAELISVGADGYPLATRLPVIWSGEKLLFHMAIANPHWRVIEPGSPALAVVTGPEGYVSPSWYAAKAEHGRVVPTWNYSAVHFRGRATVHRDVAWLRSAVSDLTDLHEGRREGPWAVTDAPEIFIDQQLKAIVGLELEIESIEAKAKRSQNRSQEDRAAVIAGLAALPDGAGRALAAQMAADLND